MTPIRFRTGRGGKQRLSTRILANQLVILALTGLIGFVLFAFAQRAELDRSYEQRALAISRTAAAEPQIKQAVEYGGGDVVQKVAERFRRASGASYVVVIDLPALRPTALSEAEAAEATGVSHATARRYLSYLVKEGMARLELRYGTDGRPEHRYRVAR
ncbi:helix-turn-helix domain-containing protein [Streptomyces paradoxus]|uniref:helix-turn-helix domain-containing protein n=1 Tax=Streptomyces paradoxus TaxID=66375 RepID=UPI0037CF0D1A